MKKKRMATDRQWQWDGKKYYINYNWDDVSFENLWNDLNNFNARDTEVIDNELMAMDLLETLVDDSANREAIKMLEGIGIRC